MKMKYSYEFCIILAPEEARRKREEDENCIYAGESKNIPLWLAKELNFDGKFGSWEQHIIVYNSQKKP